MTRAQASHSAAFGWHKALLSLSVGLLVWCCALDLGAQTVVFHSADQPGLAAPTAPTDLARNPQAFGLELNVQLRPAQRHWGQWLYQVARIAEPPHPLPDPAWAGLRQVTPLVPGPAPTILTPETDSIYLCFTLTFDADPSESATIQAQLEATGWFLFVEPNGFSQLHHVEHIESGDPQFAAQWYHDYIRTSQAWQITRGSRNVRIGVVDTGIDYNHPEFFRQIWLNPGEDQPPTGFFTPADFTGRDDDQNGLVDDVIGYDFVDQPRLLGGGDYLTPDPDPIDDNGHGTLVAGIIAAAANNGQGGAGVAPSCVVVPIRAFSGQGVGEDDDVSRAIVYAAQRGLEVINCSFGDIYPSQMMHAAIRYAHRKGCVIVGSAGNGTGDNVHYPSGFAEVISVSATDRDPNSGSEFLWTLSSYGTSVDLAAPGNSILAPYLSDSAGNPTYRYFGGTSCAAPQVAAAAALLISHRPELTPTDIRTILTTTADDILQPGWDHFTGAGRLNIRAALDMAGSGQVQITTPQNDQGTAATDTLRIIGTVLHPQLLYWEVLWQPGDEGLRTWTSLSPSPRTLQCRDSLLAAWPVATLPEGVYTLRLRARLRDGSDVEHRVRVLIDRSAPEIVVRLAAPAWFYDARWLLVNGRSSDVSEHRLCLRPETGGDTLCFEADKLTRAFEFAIAPEALPSGQWQAWVEATNMAGLRSRTADFGVNFVHQYIDTTAWLRKPYTLPLGYLLANATDLNANGRDELTLSPYDNRLNVGPVEYWEINPLRTQIERAAQTEGLPRCLPKALLDIEGQGQAELIASLNDTIYYFRPNEGQPYPTQLRLTDGQSRVFTASVYDTDGNGAGELMGKDSQAWWVMRWDGSRYEKSAMLQDTGTAYGGAPPRVAVGDFDGDGRPEIVTGDFNGRVIVYEHVSGNDYAPRWQLLTGQEDAADHLQHGDFDGDGRPEFFVATRSSTLRNNDFEYDPSYWHLRIYRATGNNQYELAWEDFLYNVSSTFLNASLAADLDRDGRDEIVLAAFPHLYYIDWQNGQYAIRSYWFGAAGTHLAAADLDRNGTQELLVGNGSETVAIEQRATFAGPQAVSRLSGVVDCPGVVQLTWQASPNATTYELYRGRIRADGSATLNLLDTLQATHYTDTDVQAGQTYVYQLRPRNPALSPNVGVFSNFVVLPIGPCAALDSAAAAGALTLEAWFATPMTDRPQDALRFSLVADDGGPVPSIRAVLSHWSTYELVLELSDSLRNGMGYTLWADTALRDAQTVSLDPQRRSARFAYGPAEPPTLYLTRWEALSDKRALLELNLPADSAALVPANYRLVPHGQVVAAHWADASRTRLWVDIDQAAFGALGYPLTLTISGFGGAVGARIIPGQGDAATFLTAQNDLSKVYVFPNPVRRNAVVDGCRFANLTPTATITIYTLDGRYIHALREENGDGGRTWDLRDAAGQRIPPGHYLFRVEAPNQTPFSGKFSVLE